MIGVVLGSTPAFADGLYVTSSGNVGIGTSSPGTSKLYVNGNRVTVKLGASDAQISLESTNNTQYDQSIEFKDPGGSWFVGQRYQTSSNVFGIGTDIGKNNLILDASGNQWITGTMSVGSLPNSAGLAVWDVCADINQRLVNCANSSMRYKQDVRTLESGLSVIEKLRPVRFTWKETQVADVGLIAEEVAKVDESFATRNKGGEIDGVQYRKMISILIRAVQEQQQQIDELRAAIARLNADQ